MAKKKIIELKLRMLKDCVSANKQFEALDILDQLIQLLSGKLSEYDKTKYSTEISLIKGKINSLNRSFDLKYEDRFINMNNINRTILDLGNELKNTINDSNLDEYLFLDFISALGYKNWKEPFLSEFKWDFANYFVINDHDFSMINLIDQNKNTIIKLKVPHNIALEAQQQFKNEERSMSIFVKKYNVVDVVVFDNLDYYDKIDNSDIPNLFIILCPLIVKDEEPGKEELKHLIKRWIQIEKLDKEDLLGSIDYKVKNNDFKKRLIDFIIKIKGVTPLEVHLGRNSNKLSIERKNRLVVSDLLDVLLKRINSEELGKAFDLLNNLDLDDRLEKLKIRFGAIAKMNDGGLVNVDDYQYYLKKLKKELLEIVSRKTDYKTVGNDEPKEMDIDADLVGLWKLDFFDREEPLVVKIKPDNKIEARKKIDLNTNLKWETKLKWLKEISTKLPNFSLFIDGEWTMTERGLKIKLTFSAKRILGELAQKFVENTIGGLVTRCFQFENVNGFQKMIGEEIGSEDNKVTLEKVD